MLMVMFVVSFFLPSLHSDGPIEADRGSATGRNCRRLPSLHSDGPIEASIHTSFSLARGRSFRRFTATAPLKHRPRWHVDDKPSYLLPSLHSDGPIEALSPCLRRRRDPPSFRRFTATAPLKPIGS